MGKATKELEWHQRNDDDDDDDEDDDDGVYDDEGEVQVAAQCVDKCVDSSATYADESTQTTYSDLDSRSQMDGELALKADEWLDRAELEMADACTQTDPETVLRWLWRHWLYVAI